MKGKLGQYTNLNEAVTTPNKSSPTTPITFDPATILKINLEQKRSISSTQPQEFEFENVMPAANSIGIVESPKCWTTIYNLLDIYAAMPEMRTHTHRLSLSPDAIANLKLKLKRGDSEKENATNTAGGSEMQAQNNFEKTRVVVFGVVKIHRTRLLATLSGLKLEAEITSFHSSTTWRKKTKPVALEFSLTGQIGRAMIVLLEGVAPNQQTVVKVTVGKSQTLYSSVTKRGKDKNNGESNFLFFCNVFFFEFLSHFL